MLYAGTPPGAPACSDAVMRLVTDFRKFDGIRVVDPFAA
jgi:hypothetical protein